jgi:uncharacterized membrane protein (UPF0127 family)
VNLHRPASRPLLRAAHRRIRSHAIALFAALGLAACAASAQPARIEDLASFPRTALEIESGAQRHAFSVWVADTPDRQAQGLMFVRDLPADQGMLFPQKQAKPVSFWMMNTYVPLDMVSIDRRWRIARIAKMTKPLSLETVPSGAPVIAVLELRGGEADRRGLRPGDRVKAAPVR